MKDSVIQQILLLEKKKIEELRALWKKIFSCEAPLQSKTYLIPRIAYRLQELTYGMLSKKVSNKLDELAKDMEKGKKIVDLKAKNVPQVGTRLIREWQGLMHEVVVMENSFLYQQKPYKSLSVIARHITGTQWNGPKFFGLRAK